MVWVLILKTSVSVFNDVFKHFQHEKKRIILASDQKKGSFIMIDEP